MITYSCKPFEELDIFELYQILRLRQEIFIVEQDCPYLDADGVDLQSSHVIGKTSDDKIIAHTRIVPKGISYENYPSIGRVVVDMAHRKSREGMRLMQFSIDECKALYPNQKIKISAQTYLDRFYKSLNFVPTGDNYLEDGIPHQAMILE